VIDVLVIGAGPAGSAAAIDLARAGWRVRIVERARLPRRKPCGEYYNPEAARLLAGLGVLDALRAAGAYPVGAVTVGAPSGKGFSVPLVGQSPAEQAFTLPREVLDTLLARAAVAAGAELWEGVTAREPVIEGGAVCGAVVRVDGEAREVRARLTLAADGIGSRFARRLGLAAGDGGRRKLGLTARYRAALHLPPAVGMHAGTAGCCGLVVRGAEANLGMVVDAARAREMGGEPARFFEDALAEYPTLVRSVEGSPLSVTTIGSLTWTTASQALPGCLLLGDAAGFYDPFTGQGVTFALLSARLAAEVAGQTLAKGTPSGERLSEYSARWSALLAPRVYVQKVIQAILERPQLRDRVLDRLEARPGAAETLIGVVADMLPPSRLLRPGFLAALLV
jgi:menaquinone-9 beta-reductase